MNPVDDAARAKAAEAILETNRSWPSEDPIVGTDFLFQHARGVIGCGMPCDPLDVAPMASQAAGLAGLLCAAAEIAGARSGIHRAVARESVLRGLSNFLVAEIAQRPDGPVH
jgi:hypothetical protein